MSRVIDIATVPMPVDDAGEAIKDPAFSAAMTEADGLLIVSPEYNHSFPGLLKHVLDSCLSEYIHKAVGIVGVSAGPFAGTRVIQGLLPVMREIGLVTIFWDVNIGTVRQGVHGGRAPARRRRHQAFGSIHQGTRLDGEGAPARSRARERGRGGSGTPACRPLSACGTAMTHHADKEVASVPPVEDVTVLAAHTCANCGAQKAW